VSSTTSETPRSENSETWEKRNSDSGITQTRRKEKDPENISSENFCAEVPGHGGNSDFEEISRVKNFDEFLVKILALEKTYVELLKLCLDVC
jgi:hypothetical protein